MRAEPNSEGERFLLQNPHPPELIDHGEYTSDTVQFESVLPHHTSEYVRFNNMADSSKNTSMSKSGGAQSTHSVSEPKQASNVKSSNALSPCATTSNNKVELANDEYKIISPTQSLTIHNRIYGANAEAWEAPGGKAYGQGQGGQGGRGEAPTVHYNFKIVKSSSMGSLMQRTLGC
ncbi:hypothetical protein MSAN_01966300 [Mycena sanguinolenta]|uniref:Uncharacterized protein n=1 Tax=Mycena sanguinolenta TaxID=230812 RepID=A0A8H6XP77_9AGAR|nr:hypothetical protein MSAN_01966300 [Mycena sanguinolenta]